MGLRRSALSHSTLVGNAKDVQTVRKVVDEVETRFGKSKRVWVMDRGMISDDTLAFLSQRGRRYLLATRRAWPCVLTMMIDTRFSSAAISQYSPSRPTWLEWMSVPTATGLSRAFSMGWRN